MSTQHLTPEDAVFTSSFLQLPSHINLKEDAESALWDTMRHMVDPTAMGREVNETETQEVERFLREKLSEDDGFAQGFVSQQSAADRWTWLTGTESGIAPKLNTLRISSQDRHYANTTKTNTRLAESLHKIAKSGITYRDRWVDMEASSEAVDHGTACISDFDEGMRGVWKLHDYLHKMPLDTSQWTWRLRSRDEYLEKLAETNCKLQNFATKVDSDVDRETHQQLANIHKAYLQLTATPRSAVQNENDSEALWDREAYSAIQVAISTLRGKHNSRLPSATGSVSTGRGSRGQPVKTKPSDHARGGRLDKGTPWRESIKRHRATTGTAELEDGDI